ncbi:hypothetical protein ACFPM3_06205 [Streptomyces coeruleoprunus]|uniref:Uncharacterized protein n=1 Tax=Streptomyces coeruleoprunus TaxID=285563 RepID=A0ABV9XAG6_9ACTN
MTPYSLAFYVDVVTSGTVLGLRPTDGPEQVTGLLGDGFGENTPDAHTMWRDYGMAEFSWVRDSARDPWDGHHFTLQVHRLASGDAATVNDVLRARYGRFGRRLRFAKLRTLLERRGVPLVEITHPANAPHYQEFWQPESRVSIMVVGTRAEYITPSALRSGDVYRISGVLPAAVVEARRKG